MAAQRKANVDDIDEIYDSFENAEMLFMSEVDHILTETLSQRKKEEGEAYDFGPVVEKAYNYSKRFSTFHNSTHPQHIKQQLSDPSKYGFQGHEITLLGNLCPDNLDEALHLIPSLKQHMEEGTEKIDNALAEIQKFCRE